jgi:transcriptional regulator of acetoin/glycerol metabolism
MLLRVLEDGTYSRIGETAPRRADFRLVGATCRDLAGMVRNGAFRSELFYRLHGANLVLPPLRRRTDKVALATALLAELWESEGAPSSSGDAAPELSADAVAFIESSAWPGNVRELKSSLRHALLLREGNTIAACDFPPPIVDADVAEHSSLEAKIDRALHAHGGNRLRAAKALGIARSTLYRVLSKRS